MITVAGLTGVRAAIFDFNGTITDDETLQFEIYAELTAEILGYELGRDTYFTDFAGRSDPEIVTELLARRGHDERPDGDLAAGERLLAERLRRYAAAVRDRPPVRPGTAALIRALHGRLPLAVTTGAMRAEVDAILAASGLRDAFDAIVTIEDLNAGKPDPEGFLLALDLLKRRWQATTPGSPPLEPDDVVVFEDSPYGIAAAHAAGMRCVAAHLTTEPTGFLPGAVVDTLGPEILGP